MKGVNKVVYFFITLGDTSGREVVLEFVDPSAWKGKHPL